MTVIISAITKRCSERCALQYCHTPLNAQMVELKQLNSTLQFQIIVSPLPRLLVFVLFFVGPAFLICPPPLPLLAY